MLPDHLRNRLRHAATEPRHIRADRVNAVIEELKEFYSEYFLTTKQQLDARKWMGKPNDEVKS